MGKLTDLIAGEQADAEVAASAAALGRSITGFSGRHTEMGDGPIAGAPVEPLRGPAAAAARSAAARTVRPKRVPFGGATLSLQVPQRPGYARYWFNDEPGRVGRARAAGYTHVLGQDGEPVSRVTGRNEGGIGRKSYLMEIPADWY